MLVSSFVKYRVSMCQVIFKVWRLYVIVHVGKSLLWKEPVSVQSKNTLGLVMISPTSFGQCRKAPFFFIKTQINKPENLKWYLKKTEYLLKNVYPLSMMFKVINTFICIILFTNSYRLKISFIFHEMAINTIMHRIMKC